MDAFDEFGAPYQCNLTYEVEGAPRQHRIAARRPTKHCDLKFEPVDVLHVEQNKEIFPTRALNTSLL